MNKHVSVSKHVSVCGKQGKLSRRSRRGWSCRGSGAAGEVECTVLAQSCSDMFHLQEANVMGQGGIGASGRNPKKEYIHPYEAARLLHQVLLATTVC